MNKIIERLRKEKMESLRDFKSEGFMVGFEFAKEAPYLELQNILAWETNNPADIPTSPEDNFRESMKEYFDIIIEEDITMDSDDWRCNRYNESIISFITGWKKGVEAFWNKVKDII